MRPRKPLASQRGFTLLEMAVVLLIIALVMGAAVVTLSVLIERQHIKDTQERLDRLQRALLHYSTSFGYLPCPANLENAPNVAHFGKAGLPAGDCISGGPPAANFNDGGNVVVGMIPTKTLGLADIDALDGWGRRFFYAVDKRLTAANALDTYPQASATPIGDINVKDDADGVRTADAVYVIVSAGPDGHGAYLAQGGTSRRNVNNNDDHTKQNCHCSNAAVPTATGDASYNTFVQRWISTGIVGGGAKFDDIVRFATRADLRRAATEIN